MEAKDLEQALWPISVVQDRYRGTYSGGAWVAIPHSDMVEMEFGVWGSDPDAIDWARKNAKKFGVGETPNEALEDLYEKVLEFGLEVSYNPYDRIAVLEDAIRRHKEMVLEDPSKTEEAEELLWSVVGDQDQG